MLHKLRSRKTNEPSRADSQLPFKLDGGQQELNGEGSTSNVATNPGTIEIVAQGTINSVAFLPDGEHVVSGGWEKKIRQWRVKDGKEVGKPMDTGSGICDLAITQDGKWIVCGTHAGQVIVWDAKSHEMVTKFRAHRLMVNALDVSADGTKVATGGDDKTVSVWSFPAGKRLLGPLKYDGWVVAVNFSPDMRLIATTTWTPDSVRVYDSSDGSLLADFPIGVGSGYNGCLAWASNSNRLFASSEDGNIHYLDVSTKKTLAKWRIHSDDKPRCISVACNDTIIAASANSSLSLWDTKTHQQIGTVIHHSHFIRSMTISPGYDIASAGGEGITLRNLYDILPPCYRTNVLLERKIRCLKVEKPDIYDMVMFLRARDARQKVDIANLEKTIQELRTQLATSNEEKTGLNETINSLRTQNETSKVDIANLEETVQELRDQLATSNKEKTDLNEMIKSLLAQTENSNRKTIHLDESNKELRSMLVASQGSLDRLTQTIKVLRADIDLPGKSSVSVARKINELERSVQELDKQIVTCKCALRVYDKKYECETLYTNGRIYDAAQNIVNVMTEDLWHNKLVIDWLKEFVQRCVSRLQEIGDVASSSKKYDEALLAYSTVLLLTPSPPEGVLMGWARMALISRSASEVLGTVKKFKLPMFHVYRAVCNVLEGDDRLMEAAECFRRIELSEETSAIDERRQWELDFRQRCSEKLEKEGDVAMDIKNHDAAIGSYSIALSLHPTNINEIIVRCCKARVGLLEDELVNVTEITERDPSNYKGYKRKHAALHSLGRYKEAFNAYEMMLSRMENSLDPQVQDIRGCYLDTTPVIRQVVEQTIHDIPRVLINTTTGRLFDKVMQAAAFEQVPVFDELRSFMTTHDRLDCARIQKEVEKFYEYVMFSHRWQPPEPSFQMVANTDVYGLPTSHTIDKLINFCKLVQSHRFRWAWSDTCCVNQSDKGVQQESVVAMFQWYCRAAMTIVHLLGVLSESQKPGSLWKSIWNTRGWTYQEYVASRVVQFYTEDWKPYLGLEIVNHKESPIILAEMEQATMFATEALATLQPGLTRVREKLYLASKRQTTRKEDIAYCLFGIFDVALPIIYGEGTRAVRRLLEYILTQSGNVALLSWTRAGNSSGSTNSYLPTDLTVYDQIEPRHVPQPIETAEMDRMIMDLQSSLPDPLLAVQLYERLYDLPPLSIVTGRLRLPGFVFSLTSLTAITAEPGSDSVVHAYHATAPILGNIHIETNDDLVGMHGLVLVHPWISPLLDRDFSGGAPQFNIAMRALRVVVRLKQPFGALLLASHERVLYKRVATDSFIKVQIRAETPLEELMGSVRTVDVQ